MSKVTSSDKSILFVEESLVSRSHRRGKEKEMRIPVGSGPMPQDWLDRLGPSGSFSRTLQEFLVSRGDFSSRMCSLNWRLKVMKSGRPYCQLQVSALPIDETASGSSVGEKTMLKTPAASEGEGGEKSSDKYWNADQPKLKLRDQVARFGQEFAHTPRTVMPLEDPEKFRARMNSKRPNDRKNGMQNLAVQIAALAPTPTTRDWKGGRSQEKMDEKGRNPMTNNLCDAVETGLAPTPTASDHKGRGPNPKQGGIDQAVKLIPTPRVGGGGPSAKEISEGNPKHRIETEIACLPVEPNGNGTGEKLPSNSANRLRLSPEFTEFMMGLKLGYTDLTVKS